MHPLDWMLLGVALVAAYHGFHVGAVAQLLAFVGFIVGLVAGVAILLTVAPHLHSSTQKTALAIACLVVPGAICGTSGRHLGELAWSAVRRLHVGPIDSFVGAAIAVAGTLVFCWLFASILVNSALTNVSAAVSSSLIIRQIQNVLPPVPNEFSAVEQYVTQNGFPDALINVLPESPEPVTLPDNTTVAMAVSRAGASVVKVVALGCGGNELEGSGFVVTGDLVVTNAHVIAGTNSISVRTRGGATAAAVPIAFDPELDVAVLRTTPLGIAPLTMATGFASRGDPAVVIGYPGGGPFTALPAGILSRFEAQGRDIYDASLTNRVVYQLDAVVRPGNSGGPLVAPNGSVIGVVFSRSSSDPNIGFALAMPAVEHDVAAAANDRAPVATGSCIG